MVGVISSPITPPPSPPPPEPPVWKWSCHLCGSTFPIGATRRCLHDGHYFCSGSTLDRRTKRIHTHRACGSVFDYAGWQAWGDWRRRRAEESVTANTPEHASGSAGGVSNSMISGYSSSIPVNSNVDGEKNCHLNCNFPSECRWRPRLEAQKAAAATAYAAKAVSSTRTKQQKVQRAEMQVLIEEPESPTAETPAPLNIRKAVEPKDELLRAASPVESISPESPSEYTATSPVSPLNPEVVEPPSPTRAGNLLSKIIASAERRAAGLSASIVETFTAGGLSSHPPSPIISAFSLVVGDSAASQSPQWSDAVHDATGDAVMSGTDTETVVSLLSDDKEPMKYDAGTAEIAIMCGQESGEWDWSTGGLSGDRRLDVGMSGEPMDMT